MLTDAGYLFSWKEGWIFGVYRVLKTLPWHDEVEIMCASEMESSSTSRSDVLAESESICQVSQMDNFSLSLNTDLVYLTAFADTELTVFMSDVSNKVTAKNTTQSLINFIISWYYILLVYPLSHNLMVSEGFTFGTVSPSLTLE